MSFFSMFVLQSVSGLLIVVWGEAPNAAAWVFPFLVLFASFGTASCFCMIYAVHGEIFSTLFAATAIGICNFFARVATIFAPLVAQTEGRTSMIIFTTLTTISFVLALFLRKKA